MAEPTNTDPTSRRSVMNLFVLGDSISLHYGPHVQRLLPPDVDYTRKEGADAGELDDPNGANGGDSSMVLSYLRTTNGWRGADVLLLNCGLHDIKVDPERGERQVPLGAYERNLRAIVDVVAATPTRLVWVRTTPVDDVVHARGARGFQRFSADGERYNDHADRIMAEHGVPAIDLHGFTQSLGVDLYCDHIHFHEHVREHQAAFLVGWLQGFRAVVGSTAGGCGDLRGGELRTTSSSAAG